MVLFFNNLANTRVGSVKIQLWIKGNSVPATTYKWLYAVTRNTTGS